MKKLKINPSKRYDFFWYRNKKVTIRNDPYNNPYSVSNSYECLFIIPLTSTELKRLARVATPLTQLKNSYGLWGVSEFSNKINKCFRKKKRTITYVSIIPKTELLILQGHQKSNPDVIEEACHFIGIILDLGLKTFNPSKRDQY